MPLSLIIAGKAHNPLQPYQGHWQTKYRFKKLSTHHRTAVSFNFIEQFSVFQLFVLISWLFFILLSSYCTFDYNLCSNPKQAKLLNMNTWACYGLFTMYLVYTASLWWKSEPEKWAHSGGVSSSFKPPEVSFYADGGKRDFHWISPKAFFRECAGFATGYLPVTNLLNLYFLNLQETERRLETMSVLDLKSSVSGHLFQLLGCGSITDNQTVIYNLMWVKTHSVLRECSKSVSLAGNEFNTARMAPWAVPAG